MLFVKRRAWFTLPLTGSGCEAQTIYNYRDRYPAVKAEMEAQDGKIDDIAEMKLYQALLAGESWGCAIQTAHQSQAPAAILRSLLLR
jgi:hypothetical protein